MENNSQIYQQRRAERERPPRFNKRNYIFIAVALLIVSGAVVAIAQCNGGEKDAGALYRNVEELQLVKLPDGTPEILKEYTGFTVSFNKLHHQPNYVAWELTAAEARGSLPRSSNFRPDFSVDGCATLDDYKNSGYSRGHIAPAGDMKWSTQAMEDSHFLTNICPQTTQLNGGRWSTLENKCREWAIRDGAIVIISGPILSDSISRTIGRSRVSVPDRFFKVILAPYVNPPRAIGFIMPNDPPYDALEAMATSVDIIEQITGFDFFSALPDEIEDKIEQEVKFRDWNRRSR
ncbi:MAG: DNA/RNA non-specific endonuclease [Muribaculaceae bacterium]|nr:DNA/RNA non-specific endonuclease [Muribaculaceae bacterium]